MYKFFSETKINDNFLLDEETQKHIRVIRLKNELFLINYQGQFYKCQYVFPNQAKIIEKLNINNEYDYEIIVAIPLIKQSHFEIALQKATELGAKKIIPFISEFCDKANFNVITKKERIQKILKEAAQQSFRNFVPELLNTMTFEQLLDYPAANKIMAYENEKDEKMLTIANDVMFIVGPEGGLSKKEVSQAIAANVKIVSLTKTILRAETALIYMLSKLK
ncbi:16S rRNA (uracil(1498)-N(3))-methyltransferase [Metamycoplasma neophronis]|uniref:Ribosomal RNA small subunit methyltransferase E n=1 Tax=Metamycoplasma neophronis TaxID=872983 RepID=A0ABY2Z4F0_9BACT|nr:16S rRNA (uracil(1498)-N(3))-methyltransferase [Metamycoplasma neophronis]TPR53254.1 16S rRNA (uracil(1498)-N(3))-methyltransferase [Metamycoplasma neophronis]